MENKSKFLINVVKYRVLWLIISAVLLLPGLVAIIYSIITYDTHSPLKLGIDYTGGTVFQYQVNEDVDGSKVTDINTKLTNNGIEHAIIQIIKPNNSSNENIISVRTKFVSNEDNGKTQKKIAEIIQSDYKDASLLTVNSVGATLGKELFKNSFIALTLACLGIIAYLSIRFKLDFAIAAILALLHDVLFVTGVFSILGLLFNVQIDGLFITALLTIIGFSVHDTIVVFDRIRENQRYYAKKMSFGEIVNFSVNQTLSRSINTSLTTLITLFALYFFGGVTTKDFVLTIILGIIIGTYSSIFFASILVDFWNEKKSA